MAANRPACCMTTLLLCFALLVVASSLQFQVQGGSSSGRWSEYVPVRRVVYRQHHHRWSAAAYEAFEVCDGCRCCAAANASSCVATSCCYAIDCDLPGKPFGVCAFTPRSCGCGGAAANCTQ